MRRLDKLGDDGAPRCRHCGADVPDDQRTRAIAIIKDWDDDDTISHEYPDPAKCPKCGGLWPADTRNSPVHVMVFTEMKPWDFPEDHEEYQPKPPGYVERLGYRNYFNAGGRRGPDERTREVH
jgi:hypothetical protein